MSLKIKGVFLLGGLLVSLLWAGTTGKITGRVTDATTGDGLPFAVVKIKGTQMGAFTDDQGYYVILNVPPGTYDIEVTYTGYQPGIVEGVVVEADRTIEVNIALKPTTVEVEPIIVKAKEKLIRPDVPESRQTFKGEQIAAIPVTRIQQAVSLSAGVINRGGLHIRGGRPDEVVYVVNGVEVRDPYTNATNAGVPLIAMEEASISRGGFDVDQGTTASGAILLVTRGGSDKYGFELRSSTMNFSFLGDKIYGYLDENTGDYYRDFVLGRVRDWSAVRVKRHRTGEFFNDFAIYGPLIPTRRDWAQFFIGGEYITDKNRVPVSMDESWKDKNYALNGKITVPFGKTFRFFTSGFYRYENWRNWDDNWRFALDNFYRTERTQWQLSGGINWLIANKFMNEIRFGYYYRHFKRNVFEDVDKDGVDDFDDRDEDGWVEVDIDYLKPVYYDSIQNRWVVGDYREGLDSLLKLYNGNPNMVEVNESEGYVELPFYWWEAGVANLYPAVSQGPTWWPIDTTYTAPYNRAGWGQRTRLDIEVVEVYKMDQNGNMVLDTVIKMSDKWYNYPFVPTPEYVRSGVKSLDDLLGTGWKERRTILKLGNQYMPMPWVYPRDQWRMGETKLLTFSWRLTSQLVKKTKTTAGHELLAGFEYKKMDITRYRIDYAGGLSNIYFDFVNPPFEKRPGDPENFIDWLKEHPTEPYQFAFYLRDKIEMEGMVAKVGFRFDYYNSNGYYFTDSTNPFVQDPVYGGQGIRYLNEAKKAGGRWYISPRIGISHPISERDVLHFTYGHYFQVPPYYQMITSYVFSGAFPVIGNPLLEPEKTIAYELGVKHGFTEDFIIDITAFYKDIYYWSRSNMYPIGQTGANYTSYTNEDYGYARGVEISFTKRPGGVFVPYLGLDVNYTYQIALGSFSDPEQAYVWQWARYPLPPKETYLNWDIRHSLSMVVSWIVPKGAKGFAIDDWGITVNHSYSSGAPWTPPFRNSRDAMEKINSKRLPSTQNTDLRVFKNFSIGKYGSVQLFIDVYNLFNVRNLNGIADANWYDQFGDPEGEAKNLAVWGERRRVRFGFFLKFAGF